MKRYLSTKNIAEMYDVSYDFFRNRMESTFQRGVHLVISCGFHTVSVTREYEKALGVQQTMDTRKPAEKKKTSRQSGCETSGKTPRHDSINSDEAIRMLCRSLGIRSRSIMDKAIMTMNKIVKMKIEELQNA
jgi:NH3-dependent NAD+ synthetase